MVVIEPASIADIDALVVLAAALFREDSGVHEPFADVTWPDREGAADLSQLLADDHSVVLVARADRRPVGLLVGYAAAAGPTRRPHT